MADQGLFQSTQHIQALLAQRREIASDAAKGLSESLRAETAGDLLLDLDHPNIALREDARRKARRSCPGTAARPPGAWTGDRADCAPPTVWVGPSSPFLVADQVGWLESPLPAGLHTALSSRPPPADADS